MGSLPHNSEASCFGDAVARALRARYPFHTAKLVAADLDCTIKAAENLLAGHLSAKSITRLVNAYGVWFLFDAGAALSGKTPIEIIQEEVGRVGREREEWERREREISNMAAVVRGRIALRPGGRGMAL